MYRCPRAGDSLYHARADAPVPRFRGHFPDIFRTFPGRFPAFSGRLSVFSTHFLSVPVVLYPRTAGPPPERRLGDPPTETDSGRTDHDIPELRVCEWLTRVVVTFRTASDNYHKRSESPGGWGPVPKVLNDTRRTWPGVITSHQGTSPEKSYRAAHLPGTVIR